MRFNKSFLFRGFSFLVVVFLFKYFLIYNVCTSISFLFVRSSVYISKDTEDTAVFFLVAMWSTNTILIYSSCFYFLFTTKCSPSSLTTVYVRLLGYFSTLCSHPSWLYSGSKQIFKFKDLSRIIRIIIFWFQCFCLQASFQ